MKRTFEDGLISVVIPVFNSEKFIYQTLCSVQEQTYPNIEIIVVNDASTDKSDEKILDFMKQYTNIKYCKNQIGKGAAKARNKALAMATGRYVAFLDSDDIWKPNKLKKQLHLMKQKNAVFTYTAMEIINEDGELIKAKRAVRNYIDYSFLLKNTMIGTSTVMIDRNRSGDFYMPDIKSGQDYATWLSLLRKGIIAYGINEALVQYRVHSNSLSSNKLKSVLQVWKIQVYQEKISCIHASVNTAFFIVNAFRKHYGK